MAQQEIAQKSIFQKNFIFDLIFVQKNMNQIKKSDTIRI